MPRPVRLVSPEPGEEELQSEARLRPVTLEEYVGQERVKENLRVFIQAARGRGTGMSAVSGDRLERRHDAAHHFRRGRGARFAQHTGRDTLTLLGQSDQQVLGADVGMAELA